MRYKVETPHTLESLGHTMDSAILSATSGLLGSLVGGLSTFAASWFTTRNQYRAQTLVQQAVRREALYAEFVAKSTSRTSKVALT